MAYEEDLAARTRVILHELGVDDVHEQQMFGGLAFLVGGHLAVGSSAQGAGLLVRATADVFADLVKLPGIEPMQMGKRASKSFARVDPHVTEDDASLRELVEIGVTTARSLPPKT